MDVEVFIGDLSDPTFDYENGNWSGNTPKRISDFFPNPHAIYFKFLEKIEKKEIRGRQTDWVSWTAILKPNEMNEVLTELYGDKVETDKKVRRMLTFISQLDQDKQYGLVACEMS